MLQHLVLVSTLITLSPLAQAKLKVIYGEDDRKDVYETKNALHLNLAKATAGMVHLGAFSKADQPRLFNLRSRTLESSQNVCATENFAKQSLAPVCSGFLVGPDVLVTAGHCYAMRGTPESNCSSYAWVFGYDLQSPTHNPAQNVSMDNIYLCKKVLAVKLDDNLDFAVIKLNRPVTDRAPVAFRKTGAVSNNTNLVVIGHPSGLPTKISPSGKVIDNSEATTFVTSLDTFHGNSGSAVFDSDTGLVEGILIQGKNDYVPSVQGDDNSCQVVNRCDELGMNCSDDYLGQPSLQGEVVFRIEQIASIIETALKE